MGILVRAKTVPCLIMSHNITCIPSPATLTVKKWSQNYNQQITIVIIIIYIKDYGTAFINLIKTASQKRSWPNG